MTTREGDGTVIYTPFPDYELEDPPGANNDITRTTYRLVGQMVGVRVKTPTGNTFYYPFTDHLGNVVAMSWRGAGVVANSHARYDPYGNFRTTPTATNPSLTSRGFTGHAHNNTGVYPTQNVGLIYMNARYYLPEIGRFISADTIVPGPANPQSHNRYAYAHNSPVNYTDPTGHCIPMICGAIIGAVGGAAIAYGAQVVANISQNGLTVDALTDVNWAAVGGAAVAGAVGGATFGLLTAPAALGGGFIGTVTSGTISGAAAGQAGQAAENVFSGRRITEGLGDTIVTDAVIGGISAGLVHRGLTSKLQSITDDVSARLGSNPSLAHSVLSPSEYAAGQASPPIARMQYGNAVERMVADQVDSGSVTSRLMKHVGGPRQPDFKGRGVLGNLNFDVTTNNTRTIQRHLARPGYGHGLNIITYERPPGFWTLP